MADNTDKKISELTTASEIKNSDNLELSQDTGSGLVSLKATILAIANKIVSNINFTSALETNSKTITGAINEVAQGGGGGGSSTLDGLNDVDIDDTTLADGQALVYDEIEEKWVNGQGGGGTGGHTIIDENGTSMTARAGLQFVGGANVSDDATNNKTIVDLASAGGIDGVFVDTDNVIVPETSYSGSLSYTATEDCVAFVNILATSSGSGWVYIDNKVVGRTYFVGTAIINGAYYLLKKGQTLTAYSQTYSGIDITYAVYGIQTGTTHSKFQPVIYSTEEREIGVWTDGKPLYEKTIHTGALSVGEGTKPHNISNFGILISATGMAYYSGYVLTFPFISIGQNSWNVGIGGADTNNIITEVGSSFTGTSAITDSYITLQYTKSTDVAGSGSWTPQGVPTHHYSTDEQVIGTFLGETLYEKTWTNLNVTMVISGGNWQEISDVDLTGVAIIVESKVWRQGGTSLVKNSNIAETGVSSNQKLQLAYLNGNYGGTIKTITLQYTKSSS